MIATHAHITEECHSLCWRHIYAYAYEKEQDTWSKRRDSLVLALVLQGRRGCRAVSRAHTTRVARGIR
jgi:hypothetical protein